MDESGISLLDYLARRMPQTKRTTLRRMLSAGRIKVNGRRAKTMKQVIGPQDRIEISDGPVARQAASRRQSPLPIIMEDEDLIVIDKPAGVLTSTVPREKRPTAFAMMCDYARSAGGNVQVGLIHRLDRDASGLLVFSKNHETFLSLKRQFFDHSVGRAYLAKVWGVPNPQSGTIDSRLIERADGSMRVSDQPGAGERAITEYQMLSRGKRQALLRVTLFTGKKHQIRAQLAARGNPIVNDPVYGEQPPAGRLLLAAVELAFVHPRSGKRLTLAIDPPVEFAEAL